jgi:iron complex outermembrane receptor protein
MAKRQVPILIVLLIQKFKHQNILIMQINYKIRFLTALAMLLTTAGLYAQDMVSGKVTDAMDGSPIPGVNVILKDTPRGTVTGLDGTYQIAASDQDVLVFSFVGYTSEETVVGNRSVIDISMNLDVTSLSEIVVVGYGETRKEDLTGAVAVIDSKDFNKGVMASPQELLVGKMAGVQVVAPTGAPGASSTIRIRGGSSLRASNDPLIVIDGFPVDNTRNSATDATSLAGMPNPLASINPNDIESITVLKDASATAIYGSRASNGVVIVTTKRGQEGKPLSINYAGTVSTSEATNLIDVYDGDEYRTLMGELLESGLSGLNQNALSRLGDANTDWQQEIYRRAVSNDHNVSITGATENMPYRASYGYTNQQGILKTTLMERHTVSIGLDPSFFDDHLKLTVNGKGMKTFNDFGKTDAISAAVAYDPTQPIFNDNTRYAGYHTWINLDQTLPGGGIDKNGDPNPLGVKNPVALLDLTENRSSVYRGIGNVQLDYKFHFLPELKATVNAGMDYAHSEGYDNAPATAPWTYTAGVGQLRNYTAINRSEVLDMYLNYKKELDIHRFDVTAGYSWQHFKREGSNYNRNAAETIISEDSEYANENYLVSFFGRLNYTLLDKYLLTVNLRSDGSSRFSEDNRWGFFPGLAFAWQIKDEAFLADNNTISDLKLRLGYGITGQQEIYGGVYPYLPIYRQSTETAQYQLGDEFYYTWRPDPYDANIKWEETTTYNIGVDFGLFNNRLTGSVDVYKRITDDLINFIPIAAGSNFSNFLTTNVGSLENQGVELSLNGYAISTEKVSWNVGMNLTYNENEITRLLRVSNPDYPGIDEGDIGGGTGNKVQNNQVGFPNRSFFVFEQVYNESGMPIEGLYVDRSGSGGEVISNNLNKYHSDNPAPEYLIGVNSSLNVNNFDFSFSGRLNLGAYVYNNVFSERALYSQAYNQSGFFNNLPTAVESTGFVDPQYWSDHYVESADFFRMDFMSLGYNFGGIFNDLMQARVSFTVQNAFLITEYNGLDPEVESGIDQNIYPRPRTFLFGVNLSF